MKKFIGKTLIYKLRGDWIGETYTEVQDQVFKIFTFKSKNTLRTTATPVELGTDVVMFSSNAMFNFKTDILTRGCNRVTEKAISAHHAEALIIFDKMLEEGKIKGANISYQKTPKIKQIIYFESLDSTKGDDNNRFVVYKIEERDINSLYHTVEVDSLELRVITRPRNIKEKFGIGYYFEDDYMFDISDNDLNNLVLDAIAEKNAQDEKIRKANLAAKEARKASIEKGKMYMKIPEWAEAVIVGRLYQNDSDYMTDYFATSYSKTIILGFSKTKRNNSVELVEHTTNAPETKDLVNEEIHRTESSHLPSYFLGTKRWFGWKVLKDPYLLKNQDELYYLAGQGLFYGRNEPEEKKHTPPVNIQSEEKLNIQYVDYSEKAFALIGETKELKDELKKLGGRFNARLSCGAGWIFSKEKSEKAVRDYFNGIL